MLADIVFFSPLIQLGGEDGLYECALTTSFCGSTVVPTLRLLVRLSAYIHLIFVAGNLCPFWINLQRPSWLDYVVATTDMTYYYTLMYIARLSYSVLVEINVDAPVANVSSC